jgi:hypothetical protein
MKVDEMGGTCGSQGGGERFLRGFSWKALREETTEKT